MRISGGILTIVAASLLAVPATAGPGARHCHRDGDKPHRIWGELGLSEEQQSKLKELHEEIRTARKEHWAKMKELRDQVRAELAKEKPSRSALDGFIAQQADHHRVMTATRIDHLLEIKEILTKEQFDKLLDRHWIGGRGGCGHRKGGRGRGGHGRRGPS
jgi:Spy/CpxP family protein refolding chaperone